MSEARVMLPGRVTRGAGSPAVTLWTTLLRRSPAASVTDESHHFHCHCTEGTKGAAKGDPGGSHNTQTSLNAANNAPRTASSLSLYF